jgi:hypothetical protein
VQLDGLPSARVRLAPAGDAIRWPWLAGIVLLAVGAWLSRRRRVGARAR